MARWRRDGFGSLSVKNPEFPAAMVTCPIQARGTVSIRLNAEGLSERAWLRVELLDRWERPVPGYSGSNSAAVNKSGLRELVSWKGQKRIQGLSSGFKIRVNFEGERQDIRLYALYVGG